MNLRQLRVKNVTCDRIDSPTSCMPFYDIAVANDGVVKNEVVANTTYKSATETGAAGIHGKFGFYGGDGYLVTFDANMNGSVVVGFCFPLAKFTTVAIVAKFVSNMQF
jgi:hypothetical protein